MNNDESFALYSNIKRFEEMLEKERDPGRRVMLARLLEEQRAKAAAEAPPRGREG